MVAALIARAGLPSGTAVVPQTGGGGSIPTGLNALAMGRGRLGDREKMHRATSVNLFLFHREGHVHMANVELFVEM